MVDDIDDLLDECETKFCDSSGRTPQKSSSKTSSNSRKKSRNEGTSRSSQTRNKEQDELYDMIKECMDDGPEIPEQIVEPLKSLHTSKHNDPSSSRKRCVKVFLAGSKFPKGLCCGSEERACDRLRCTSCDFSVVILNDYEWQVDCDYLFFRNNIPDFEKLKSKLTRKRGCCAYACQCSWRSITQLTELWSSDPQLKWVCGKHS